MLAWTSESVGKISAALGDCFSCRRCAVERLARQNEKLHFVRLKSVVVEYAQEPFLRLVGDMSRWLDIIFQNVFPLKMLFQESVLIRGVRRATSPAHRSTALHARDVRPPMGTTHPFGWHCYDRMMCVIACHASKQASHHASVQRVVVCSVRRCIEAL